MLGQRKDYSHGKLDLGGLLSDPLAMLEQWLIDAGEAGSEEPSAMCLSTVSLSGQPSGRMVLLRGIDHGLIFYTNYGSRKGKELEGNAACSATFWWPVMQRQVRVEGRVEKVDSALSDAYFESRPRDSQLASSVSPQSEVIPSKEQLIQEIARLEADGSPVRRPGHWGGYRILPSQFEFWQGGLARLHDRFRFMLSEDGWVIERLAP
jgi:pyridoxamine 5'-phosphate oxidase